MSSVRDKKNIFTAEIAESAEKRLKKILTADTRRCTRTDWYKAGKLGGWEVRKSGSELKLEVES